MRWELEELARAILESSNVGPPVDPEEIAFRLGLLVQHSPGCEGLLVGERILVDDSLRPQRRAFAIAHELGHHLQRLHGLSDTEAGANYLASALLLPRDDFERDLRRHGWDLLRLCCDHRFASFEAVARRIVALREARAFVFDNPLRGQRESGWYSVPWGLNPSEDERIAAQEAVDFGGPVEVVAGVTGWPVIEHDWVRVITLTST